MAGLLSDLFGWNDFPVWTTPGINPEAPMSDPFSRRFGIDPDELRKEQFRQQLINFGFGLASGKNWQEGVTKGVQGFAAARDQVQDDLYRKGMLGMEYERLFKSLEPEPGWATLT